MANLPPRTNYRVTVSATGYTTKAQTAITVTSNNTTTVNVVLRSLVTPIGSVTGTITDSISTEALESVRVILTRSVAGFTPETTTTNVMGAYSFTNIEVNTGYTVTASKADFYTKSSASFGVTDGTASTQNLALKAITSTITGLITNATGGAKIAMAKVVLKSRTTGTTFDAIDSMTTDTSGIFGFGPLPLDTYRVVVSANGFYADSSSDAVLTDGSAQTRDIDLAPVGRGTLRVRVRQDSTGNPAIAGARVYAILTSTTLTQDTLEGVTDANGSVDIASAFEGNYTIWAYAAGFVAISTTRQLINNEVDSCIILVARYAGTTKTLGGWVRTSSGVVANATCSLNVGLYTFVATSNTFGDYSFTVPNSFTSGVLNVVAASCLPWGDSTVSLSAASNTKNVTMEISTAVARTSASVAAVASVIAGRNSLTVSAPVAGTLSMFSLDGKLVRRVAVDAGVSTIQVRGRTSQTLLTELVAGDTVIRGSVVLR